MVASSRSIDADDVARDAADGLATRYGRVRATTEALCRPLEPEDFAVQSMPDASPAKWHLAHTTWFFEEFVLQRGERRFRWHDPRFRRLFNSYYQSVGPVHPRPERGLLTRPTVAQVLAYRASVDERMRALLAEERIPAQLAAVIELGIHHEQQHQELILTDIKHAFSRNPLLPAYAQAHAAGGESRPLAFVELPGGLVEIGHGGGGFHFDNEAPRHREWVGRFALADRLVTNGEFRDFVEAGGYEDPRLWLSDGWDTVQREGWRHPLYWTDSLDDEFTLAGPRDLDPHAPVCHLSHYEADAFARWAGARLPTEAEWETAAAAQPVVGNFLEDGHWHPVAAGRTARMPGERASPAQMFGDVWEWTSSAYAPYPGYRPAAGALGEYNGKFMVNQLVLRGGSCLTPRSHVRATYRNFFYPSARWQMTGIRLAKDS